MKSNTLYLHPLGLLLFTLGLLLLFTLGLLLLFTWLLMGNLLDCVVVARAMCGLSVFMCCSVLCCQCGSVIVW